MPPGELIHMRTSSTTFSLQIILSTTFLALVFPRVDWLVTKHLSAQVGQIQAEGSIVSGVQTKLEPLLLMHLTH